MGKIYEKNLGYTILKPIVDSNLRNSYRRFEIRGEENLPNDGVYILAPNHTNTLMDALVILRANKGITVFGARADMFNKPIIAKIMHFLRILPMVRQRDGLRNVLKNYETTDVIVETLESGATFCMYPEGRHRPAHSLLPLGKGVFRAALAANAKFGEKTPVYIVPVGIEYGDYFRYRSTVLVTYGEAINITGFISESETDNEAQIIDALRKKLESAMSGLITYIPDDEELQDKWTLVKMLAADARSKGKYPYRLSERLEANRRFAADIEKNAEHTPETTSFILDRCKAFEQARKASQVSMHSFASKNLAVSLVLRTLIALIGLPYFIFSSVVTLPMWATAIFLRGKIRDRAFHNTATFGVKLGGSMVMGLILCPLAFCLMPLWCALAFLMLTIPAYSFFHDYLEGCRRTISGYRLAGKPELRKIFKDIIEDYSSL